MQNMPTVRKYMTPAPVTVESTTPLLAAAELMKTHQIRHLPVLANRQVVGILSERDLRSATKVVPGALVCDVMTPTPVSVHVETPVDDVALVMSENKYGCVIVRESDGTVAGIFTTTDALELLVRDLRDRYLPSCFRREIAS